jgi:hypothetical protein
MTDLKKDHSQKALVFQSFLFDLSQENEIILDFTPKPIIIPIIEEIIPESDDILVRKVHKFFIESMQYKEPMTVLLIKSYNMIHEKDEYIHNLMNRVIHHYRDIEQVDYKGQIAYQSKVNKII